MNAKVLLALAACAALALAEEPQSAAGIKASTETKPGEGAKPAEEAKPGAAEVTLKGVLMLEEACTLKPEKGAGEVPVLFALEGPPSVTEALDAIMKTHWPGDSMDAKQAMDLNESFVKRLKYYLTPCALTTKASKDGKWGNPLRDVTGFVCEKEGKKWITPSKIQDAKIKYPDKMLAPDKPLKSPGKEPLILKITDTLLLRCILLPAGDFLFEKPYYVQPRWQDEFPRHITLTKPLWMAEIPVTQEMWEAVMGNNPSTLKDPKRPVRNATCTDANKFCQLVSEKNGRKVRLPGEAEWEYAARVGTSNPQFDVKYQDQDSSGPERTTLPVKSKQPNAWGLYDMIASCAFEMTRDKFAFSRQDASDPYDSCEKDEAAGRKHAHWGRNLVTYHEGVNGGTKDKEYGSTKIRVVVEATPEEISALEKATGQ
ncbi:MAG: formylglycine-generating enzyme family protein [Planctomycetota bacterium]|nr:formylglycine-generating enzyme family protein [Planctomycetota bacterium]